MTEDHVSRACGEFKLSITRALADQLADALNELEHAPLTTENVEALEARPGVYELYLRGELVYVGKASQKLTDRLRQHRRKISGRERIELSEVSFQCLYVEEDLEAAAPEKMLLKKYKLRGSIPWNTNGFGNKDPGRQRDHTLVKENHFDAHYPVNLDLVVEPVTTGRNPVALRPGHYPVKKYLQGLKRALPFNLRFPTDNPPYTRGGGTQPTVEVDGPRPFRELIRRALYALPEGWQATALPGYVILYPEIRDYASATQFWLKREGVVTEPSGQGLLDAPKEIPEEGDDETEE